MEPWGATRGKKLMCESARWLTHGFAHGSQSQQSVSLMPTTCRKTCCSMKEPSPAQQCESGELSKGPMPSASPLLEPVQTITQTMLLLILEPSACWDFETGKEWQNLMLDTMSRPISCIWSYKARGTPHLEWIYVRWYWNFSNFKKSFIWFALAIGNLQGNKNQHFHQADILLADPSTVLHSTFQELGVKIEKRQVYR